MILPKAIVVERPGGYEKLTLRDLPQPTPGPGCVRVSVRAAGVNYADTLVRMGLYAAVPSYPITPGFEFSGTVAETGPDAGRFKPGDAVFGILRFGAYATEVVVPETHLWPKPAAWSFEQAAGLPAVAMTSYIALKSLAHVQPGEKVLIHSAAGGVGTAAIQIAKILGADVTAIVGAPHKVDLCRALGANQVIDKSAADLWREAERLAPKGYDAILDPNGQSTLKASYDHLAQSGRLLIYGFASMLPKTGGRANYFKLAWDWLRTPRFNPLDLCYQNRAVIGFNVVHMFERKALLEAAMGELLGWIADGRYQPPVIATYPFAEVARAHQDIESGRTVGKLILVVGS